MAADPLLSLAAIGAGGVALQWVAWRTGLPAILLLLIGGLVAGPALGWLDPDALFGDLLFPIVSLAVAMVLFEGSLGLDRRELRTAGRVARNLLTVGATLTFALTWAAAALLLDVPTGVAALVAANLVVTGPTVIGPILRQVRPAGKVAAVLRTEGIIIDPLGAVAAVLVLEGILAGQAGEAAGEIGLTLARTAGAGIGTGVVAGFGTAIALRRHLVPEFLRQPVVVAAVVGAFAASEHLAHESGLLAVTVLGMVLANHPDVEVRPIIEFNEGLQVLLLSGLFVILAARLDVDVLRADLVPNLLLLGAVVLVVRPVAVALAAWRSSMPGRERLLLAAIAPRGIVAVAVASAFSLRLDEAEVPGSEAFAGAVITVILGTILVYGLGAGPVARRLQLSTPANGVLVVGATEWARQFAEVLRQHDVPAIIVERNRAKAATSRLGGSPTVIGSILSDQVIEGIDLGTVGTVLAATTSDEVNKLAVERLRRAFDSSHLFQLPSRIRTGDELPPEVVGRVPFGPWACLEALERRVAAGAGIKATRITEQFPLAEFKARNEGAEVLAVIRNGAVVLSAADRPLEPRAGDVLVALTRPV